MIIYPQKLEEMVLFFEVSALGVTIALVIVLVRMKVNLGIVMLSATFIMALFGKLLPVIVVKIMWILCQSADNRIDANNYWHYSPRTFVKGYRKTKRNNY